MEMKNTGEKKLCELPSRWSALLLEENQMIEDINNGIIMFPQLKLNSLTDTLDDIAFATGTISPLLISY
ncbi:hypothetical protein OUZ56_026209 [Daphnia magna]|uniref:Uncharacterized protein n=1 Tax=Daphnia magna TaxID=35525 RepID=A0ABQ9ZL31_9CRUS|nr:hypothetical protein OUZ56_026209 [Daphnia magna]